METNLFQGVGSKLRLAAWPREFFSTKLSFPHLIDSKYVSQSGEDFVVDSIFQGKRDGVFVDIGAHDGVTFSNTYFLESVRGWSGLLVEPNPVEYEKLVTSRRALAENSLVGSRSSGVEFHGFAGQTSVLSGSPSHYGWFHSRRVGKEAKKQGVRPEVFFLNRVPLQDLLSNAGIKECDLLSIDVEGAEEDVLCSIDWETFSAKIILLESNLISAKLTRYLEQRGYFFLCRIGSNKVFVGENFFISLSQD